MRADVNMHAVRQENYTCNGVPGDVGMKRLLILFSESMFLLVVPGVPNFMHATGWFRTMRKVGTSVS